VYNVGLSFSGSTYLGWLFEREEFPRDFLILAQLEAATPPDPEDGSIGGLDLFLLGLAVTC
jgi:hypothetical protein